MGVISSIAGLLSLCGIASTRMFAPTFIFGLICRVLPTCSWCPSGIVELAKGCPPFLTGNFGLFVFGVLGILEVLANWEDSVREIISEANIEKYVKPLYAAVVSYSICTPEQAQVLSAVIDGVPGVVPAACDPVAVEAVTNAVVSTMSTAAAGVDTGTVTNAVAAVVREVSGGPVATAGSSFSAIFASLFCAGGTFGLCKVRAAVVAAVRELDPDNSFHLNTFLTLVEEGSWLAILPIVMIFPLIAIVLMALLAFFGWVLSRPLKTLAEKRRAYWDAVGRSGMLKIVHMRAIVIFGLGVLLSWIPVFGYVATVIALNLLVFSVLAMYEKTSSRILAKMVMRFLKLTIFIVALLFSGIPFLSIVLLIPYFVSYLMHESKVRNQGCP